MSVLIIVADFVNEAIIYYDFILLLDTGSIVVNIVLETRLPKKKKKKKKKTITIDLRSKEKYNLLGIFENINYETLRTKES